MKRKLAAMLSVLFAGATQATSVFINEIHYDNTGSDTGEFVEVAAPQGTSLDNWSVVFYNGGNGSVYGTDALSGVVSNQSNGYGFVSVARSGIQNGAPDGLALVNSDGDVVQFLSYEGSLTATAGPADGMSSTDIGVSEPGSTPVGFSLQLSGTGSVYADFAWQSAAEATQDSVNNGQTLMVPDAPDTAPELVSTSPASGEGNVKLDASIDLVFNEDVVIASSGQLDCSTEINIPMTLTGEGSRYSFQPDIALPAAEKCTFLLSSSDVTDLDGTPDNLADNVGFGFSTQDPSTLADLVINELLADPAPEEAGDANGDGTRDSSADEFIEIVNVGDTAVDLTGWTITSAADLKHVFGEGSIVGPNCSAVVFGGGTPTGTFGGALVQTASAGNLVLANSGRTITLANEFQSYAVTYGSEGGSDQSLTRSPDLTGETLIRHTEADGADGALFSPGTQINGAIFDGCVIPDVAPFVASSNIEQNAEEVSVNPLIVLEFSERVEVDNTLSMTCSTSGLLTLNAELADATLMLAPSQTLEGGEMCTLNIPANAVVDLDGDQANTMAADYSLSFTTAAPLTCDTEGCYTLISEIQGSGDASPIQGSVVTVEAVVTALTPGQSGFFIQEQDGERDDSAQTSEGVFVFYGETDLILPEVGDTVVLRGSVSEFFDRTQITLSSDIEVLSSGATVLSTAFSLPVEALAQLESIEGMLVTSANELTVTDNFGLGRFGQLVLSNGRVYTPNNVTLPGSPENLELLAQIPLNRILLDDGSTQQNPADIPFITGGLSAQNTVRSGDTVTNVTGVVDFGFGDYRVIPVELPTFIQSNPRTEQPELVAGNLSVASLNVLNFFNTVDTGASTCGPTASSGCRGADDNGVDGNGLSELERQTLKTVAAIETMDADILGLMEIENDGFGEDSSIATLVNAVNAVMGEGTYTYVTRDQAIGTDAITVALMYKPSVVNVSGPSYVLDSSNSATDSSGEPLFNDGRNRPSLIQKFALVENGEELLISVNHLKSKGSGCGAGDDDSVTNQGNCNLTRTRAAQALMTFLNAEFSGVPTLVIGDLNAYAKEDPIREILDNGYTDLALAFKGIEAYSYTFGGQLGYLDHALANSALIDKVVDTTEWHINADEPIVLDYNLDFQSAEQQVRYYAPDAYRMSDHDPVIVSLLLESASVKGDWDGDGDVDLNDIRGLIVAIQRRQEISLDFDFNDDGAVTYTDVRLLQRMCTRARCAL